MGATNVWTYTLTNDNLSVTSADNAVRLSVICRLGTVTVAGSGSFQGIPSDPVQLNEGQGVTITASVVSNPIDGVTINAATSGDIAEIIISSS
jgi:hypothetical protein